eukprot:COSAG01_NODE_75453_length_196_cov_21.814433_1_plen_36_part_10
MILDEWRAIIAEICSSDLTRRVASIALFKFKIEPRV